jgi:GTP-binding nuclear protein Ran
MSVQATTKNITTSSSSSSSSSSHYTFKVVLVGDAGVGKTALIKRHQTGDFVKKYTPTKGVESNTLSFYTTAGEVRLNILDTAGQEKYTNSIDMCYKTADAAIIMFDVTSKVTYLSAMEWYKETVNKCADIPTMLVGNKVDCKGRKVKPKDIDTSVFGVVYCDISAKSTYNFEKPFLYLIRQLMNDHSISYVEAPEVKMSKNLPSKECNYCEACEECEECDCPCGKCRENSHNNRSFANDEHNEADCSIEESSEDDDEDDDGDEENKEEDDSHEYHPDFTDKTTKKRCLRCHMCDINKKLIAGQCGHMLCGGCSLKTFDDSCQCPSCKEDWLNLRIIYL